MVIGARSKGAQESWQQKDHRSQRIKGATGSRDHWNYSDSSGQLDVRQMEYKEHEHSRRQEQRSLAQESELPKINLTPDLSNPELGPTKNIFSSSSLYTLIFSLTRVHFFYPGPSECQHLCPEGGLTPTCTQRPQLFSGRLWW